MKTFADMIKMTTTTEGTGAITLGSTVPGFRNGDILDGKTGTWMVEVNPAAPTDWEIFEGELTAGDPSTISRGKLISSSTGSRVSFAPGDKIVKLIASQDIYNTVAETADSNRATGGSAGAYTFQSNRAGTPYEGLTFEATVNHASPEGGSTLEWNGGSADDLLDEAGDALGENDLVVGPRYRWRFDGEAWRVGLVYTSADKAALADKADTSAVTAALNDKMDDPDANGFVSRTGANGASAARTIQGVFGQTLASNGDGVSGNPAIGLLAFSLSIADDAAVEVDLGANFVGDIDLITRAAATIRPTTYYARLHSTGSRSIDVKSAVGGLGTAPTLLTDTELTGTTGADGLFTLSARSLGRLGLQNRTDALRTLVLIFRGANI
ncbi:hypothetical protein [Parvibaculum sp.]|uniref:hypothetical protein n=1 Tax=Parvibaculum sp. TaxID=2024848 RepID=UPI001DC1A9AB|nr:hypothetical protein [Parvibaculum sp.]MBX3490914.1 hypothetical protein [Parvibaculum sp.]